MSTNLSYSHEVGSPLCYCGIGENMLPKSLGIEQVIPSSTTSCRALSVLFELTRSTGCVVRASYESLCSRFRHVWIRACGLDMVGDVLES